MDLSHELSRDAHILTRNFSSAKSMRGARNTHQDDSTCCDAVSFPVVQRRTWRNWKVCACRRWCEGFAPQTASARVPISRSVPLHHRRRCAVEFIMMTQWDLINYASMKPYSCMQNLSNHASPSKGSINGGSHEEIWSLPASMKPYSLRQKWSNHASPSRGSINGGSLRYNKGKSSRTRALARPFWEVYNKGKSSLEGKPALEPDVKHGFRGQDPMHTVLRP